MNKCDLGLGTACTVVSQGAGEKWKLKAARQPGFHVFQLRRRVYYHDLQVAATASATAGPICPQPPGLTSVLCCSPSSSKTTAQCAPRPAAYSGVRPSWSRQSGASWLKAVLVPEMYGLLGRLWEAPD